MREVSAETLLAAIQDGKPWLARFTGKEFDKAYQEYRERYAEGVEALAEVLLDSLAEGWKRQKPWNRSLAMLNDKQMIVCFLGPMLMEDPVCAPLEEKLREGWAARWPKEAYKTPSLAKLRKGFRPTFLGITLPFGGGDEEE